jgi:hypothetical protein
MEVFTQSGTSSSSIAVPARCCHHRQRGPLPPPFVVGNDSRHQEFPLNRCHMRLPPIATATAEMVWSDQKLLEEWDRWCPNKTNGDNRCGCQRILGTVHGVCRTRQRQGGTGLEQ